MSGVDRIVVVRACTIARIGDREDAETKKLIKRLKALSGAGRADDARRNEKKTYCIEI